MSQAVLEPTRSSPAETGLHETRHETSPLLGREEHPFIFALIWAKRLDNITVVAFSSLLDIVSTSNSDLLGFARSTRILA
jgi:hypothetical protein